MCERDLCVCVREREMCVCVREICVCVCAHGEPPSGRPQVFPSLPDLFVSQPDVRALKQGEICDEHARGSSQRQAGLPGAKLARLADFGSP